MPVLNLLDIAKMNGCEDGLLAVLDEAARAAPELTGQSFIGAKPFKVPGLGAGRTIKGTQYKTLVRTGLPTFAFRNANEGVAPSKGTYENRMVETFIANIRWWADKMVADASEDGAQAVIAEEAVGMVTSALMGLAKQFYYGRGTADAKGHPGLIDSVSATLVVDAGGTTADTGSSVWAVKFGPNHVQWVFGNNANLAVDDPRIESINDPADSAKQLTVYLQELALWAGVQVKSIHSLGRIKKLTADAGKGLTGDLLGALKAKYPVGIIPDAFLCTPRSLEQYRLTLQAASTTGGHVNTPDNFEGIPLVPTDNILNTEALTL